MNAVVVSSLDRQLRDPEPEVPLPVPELQGLDRYDRVHR